MNLLSHLSIFLRTQKVSIFFFFFLMNIRSNFASLNVNGKRRRRKKKLHTKTMLPMLKPNGKHICGCHIKATLDDQRMKFNIINSNWILCHTFLLPCFFFSLCFFASTCSLYLVINLLARQVLLLLRSC